MEILKRLAKNKLSILLIICVIACLYPIYNKIIYEQKNTNIEIAVDFDTIKNIYLSSGIHYNNSLTSYKEAGVTSIILKEDSIRNLVNDGKATLITGKEIININRISKGQYSSIYSRLPSGYSIQPELNYLIIDETNLYEYARANLEIKLGSNRVKNLGSIIEVVADTEDLLNTSIDINPNTVSLIYKHGLSVIPEISNFEGFNEEQISSKISNLAEGEIKILKFKDNEALGYKKFIHTTALKINTYDNFFAFTEFIQPKGLGNLALSAQNKALKIHYIPVGKDNENYVNRALRAIKERNASIIQIDIETDKNNFSENKEKIYIETLSLIKNLKNQINNSGYKTSVIDFIKKPQTTNIFIFQIIAYITVIVLMLMFIRIFASTLTTIHSLSVISITSILGIAAYFTDNIKFFNEIMALIASCVTPVMVFIIIKEILDKDPTKTRKYIPILLLIFISTVFTGVIINVLLFHYNYFVAIWTFRGVKLASTIPILLLAIYFFVRPKRVKYLYYVLRRYISGVVTFKYLFVALLVAVFLIFYVMRTGNYGILILGKVEIIFRELLETIFIVRPRSKEILFAVPLLMIAIHYWNNPKIDKTLKSLLLLFSSIVSISQINTFCHLHAPFITSLYRSFLGLIIGYIVGRIIIFAFDKFASIANKIALKFDSWEN